MPYCVRSRAILLLFFVFHTSLTAQSGWEDIYPAPIPASALTTFGDSLIASIDGVIHVAGGDGRSWRPLASNVGSSGGNFAYDGYQLYLADGYNGLRMRKPGDEDFHLLYADVLPVQSLLSVHDTLFITTRDALYRSVDRGVSFDRVHTAYVRSLLLSDGHSLYALFNNDSLRRSDDGGVTWTPCGKPYWNGSNSYCFHRGCLYTASSTDLAGMKRSTDGGQTWKVLPGLPVDSLPHSYLRGVITMTASEEDLLICTGRGVFRSTDGGMTWETVSEGSTKFSSLYNGPSCLLSNGPGGCFRYDASRRHWRQVEFSRWSDYGVSLAAFGRNVCGDLHRFSPDEGDSWWAQDRTTWSQCARPDGTLLRLQWNSYDSCRLERSIDDGMTWSFVDSVGPGSRDLAANQSLLLLGTPRYLPIGYLWELHISTDDGECWTQRLTLPVALTAPRVLTVNQRNAILFFSYPLSVYSPDAGLHWDTLRTPTEDSIHVAVLTENSLFIQSNSGIWQRGSDNSLHATGLTERIPQARIAGTWKSHLCVLGYDSLYFLDDISGELRAVPLPDLLVGFPYTPAFAASASCVFIAPAGTILRLKLEGILDAENPVAVPAGFAVICLHPHPVRNHANLRLLVERGGETEVDLLDILGRVRARLYSGYIDAGSHDIGIGFPALPPGNYLIRLRGGTQTQFHPLIVVR
ncbi:MAG: hypothetical protein IH600_09070 [Bacteroidetes bacterium]|nr:hypothetical protein [Bacteroidota bacterium]